MNCITYACIEYNKQIVVVIHICIDYIVSDYNLYCHTIAYTENSLYYLVVLVETQYNIS